MADSQSHGKGFRVACPAIAILAIAVLFSLIRFTPVYDIYRHMRYYGDAEFAAGTLQALTQELDTIDEASVRRLLGTEEYRKLQSLEIEMERQPDEIIWFRANDMFDIGLANDGRILWMVDGERPSQ